MTAHLEHLARRLENDPFFLACSLKLYANSESLDEQGLAARLKCSADALLSVRLCRAPAADSESFYQEIERVTARFAVDTQALAEGVRRGQALFEITRVEGASGMLLAARDGDVHDGADSAKED